MPASETRTARFTRTPWPCPDTRGRPAAPRAARLKSTTGSTGSSRPDRRRRSRAASSARSEDRMSSTQSTPGRPTTAASSRGSASRPPSHYHSSPSRAAASSSAMSWVSGSTPAPVWTSDVAIVPSGESAASAVASRAVGPPGPVDGSVAFTTAGLAPGAYDAILIDGTGFVVSRSPFWLYAPGTPTTLTTSKQAYVVGEPIDVSWAAAPGMRWDWLAIYTPGTSDESRKAQACTAGCANNGRYLMYVVHEDRDRGHFAVRRVGRARHLRLAAEAGLVRDPAARRRQLPVGRFVGDVQGRQTVDATTPAPGSGRRRRVWVRVVARG